ncbi:glycosyltransferase family 2 protein, partial [Metabacillus niabensis]
IYDDASTDRTPEIIKMYEDKYPDLIKPIYQTVNQYSKGVKVGNYNIKRAKGKYIATCEGDDYWISPFKLQKQVDYMESNPDCTLCAHTVEKVRIDKAKIGYERPYQKSTVAPTTDMILGGGYFVGTVSLLYPKRLMENPPDFYTKSPVGDFPLQIYLSSKGYAYYIDEVLAAYRIGVKGGWSQLQISGNDKTIKQINNSNKLIHMLNEFNSYTKGKYKEAIEEKIKYYEFKKAILQKDLKSIKENSFYQEFSIFKKTAVYIKMLFPNFYQKLYKYYIDELIITFNRRYHNQK